MTALPTLCIYLKIIAESVGFLQPRGPLKVFFDTRKCSLSLGKAFDANIDNFVCL